VTGPNPILHPDDDPRYEIALQLASRFWALVKSGRAYSVGHVTYTSQLEGYITLLSGALETDGVVRFDAPEGDLCMNGMRLPDRANMQRSLESLAQEFGARTLEGIEFTRGLSLGELETFMSYFLPGERWKGSELIAACDDAGLVHARALPLRVPSQPLGSGALPEPTPDAAANLPPAWRAVLAGARALLEGDAMDQGIELRHVKRLLRPLIDAVVGGERMVSLLSQVTPRGSAWSHAAHTALLAVCVGARLGLSRHDLADVAVAALLHDAGHGWGEAGGPEMVQDDREPAPHTREGLRRVAWTTTLNPTSLGVMRATLEHHASALEETGGLTPSLRSQLVSICDAYVTLLARGDTLDAWLSPNSALVRVIGPLRDRWHPALPVALVRALGVHPPGQYVELDDGSIARAMGPDAGDPERPWIETVADPRGMTIPQAQRRLIPLPAQNYVTRALPRSEWPHHPLQHPAA
jgi:HD domain-containing protein